MASKLKVDSLESTDGTGTIALNNQLSGMTVASLPSSGTLPAMDGSALTNMAAGGKLLQVVQSQTDSQTFANSMTNASVLHSLSITPSASNSTIIVFASISGEQTTGTPSGSYYYPSLYRGSTLLRIIGDAMFHKVQLYEREYASNFYKDAAGTTSAITYSMKGHNVANGGSSTWAVFNAGLLIMEIAG